jgi:hypothetical protein
MRILADITPLRESPQFRRLWVGQTLSGVGSAMTMFAVTLQAFVRYQVRSRPGRDQDRDPGDGQADDPGGALAGA